jgi:predicted transcriptional regulator
MVNRVNTLSIYIPKGKLARNPLERLAKLSEDKERSINYLVVEALLQYLDREEKKKK